MKKIILLLISSLVLILRAYAAPVPDFFEFYSVFSPDAEQVILMPSKLRVSLSPGEQEKLGLITRPEDVSVTWQSSDPQVCTADRGVLCALAEGECRVTVSCGESKAEIHVSVAAPRTRISLDRDELTINKGESALIRAALSRPDPQAQIKWHISAPDNCAAVSFGGDICRVRGLDAGHITVTASLPDGQTARAEVDIKDPRGTDMLKLSAALLFTGAAVLLGVAAYLKKRCVR